jgi:phosphoribosylglycinamide formyltransferase 1
MLSIAILGSGKGSNAQSIINSIRANNLSARIVCVISDVQDAYLLERARQNDIPAYFLDCSPFKTKLDGAAEQKVIEILKKQGADVIALAGFMRMLKCGLLRAFPGKIVNIHPALLPAFPGLQSWKQALDYGAKISGCTVHFVDEGMDTGPIILQKAVPILDGDTPESLHARIQEQEHIAYPQALQWIAENRIRVVGRRVFMESL